MADENTTSLSPQQHAKIRRLSQRVEVDPSENEGELNVVPFLDIITNVLMFVLATIPAVFTVSLASAMPATPAQPIDLRDRQSLNLSLVVVSEGVSLKTSAGNVAPGCDGAGEGVTVPKKNGSYDWDGLNACARKLKSASPDFQEEDGVRLIADPSISYKVLVNAMDAVRTTPDGDALFPDVTFGVVR
jgi:biopolymer transport protein ExbD